MNIYPVYQQEYNAFRGSILSKAVGYEASLGFYHARGRTRYEAITALLNSIMVRARLRKNTIVQ